MARQVFAEERRELPLTEAVNEAIKRIGQKYGYLDKEGKPIVGKEGMEFYHGPVEENYQYRFKFPYGKENARKAVEELSGELQAILKERKWNAEINVQIPQNILVLIQFPESPGQPIKPILLTPAEIEAQQVLRLSADLKELEEEVRRAEIPSDIQGSTTTLVKASEKVLEHMKSGLFERAAGAIRTYWNKWDVLVRSWETPLDRWIETRAYEKALPDKEKLLEAIIFIQKKAIERDSAKAEEIRKAVEKAKEEGKVEAKKEFEKQLAETMERLAEANSRVKELEKERSEMRKEYQKLQGELKKLKLKRLDDILKELNTAYLKKAVKEIVSSGVTKRQINIEKKKFNDLLIQELGRENAQKILKEAGSGRIDASVRGVVYLSYNPVTSVLEVKIVAELEQ